MEEPPAMFKVRIFWFIVCKLASLKGLTKQYSRGLSQEVQAIPKVSETATLKYLQVGMLGSHVLQSDRTQVFGISAVILTGYDQACPNLQKSAIP